MATASSVLSIVQQAEQVGNEVLAAVQALDPSASLPVETIQAIEGLANVALAAWSAASGTPVTVASVQALLPNPTPLSAPTQ